MIAAPLALTAAPAATLLAWRPFLDPIVWFHDVWWLLLIPLSFGVAMIYRAVRLPTLEHYWRLVVSMTIQTVIAMILLAAFFYALVEWFVPLMTA